MAQNTEFCVPGKESRKPSAWPQSWRRSCGSIGRGDRGGIDRFWAIPSPVWRRLQRPPQLRFNGLRSPPRPQQPLLVPRPSQASPMRDKAGDTKLTKSPRRHRSVGPPLCSLNAQQDQETRLCPAVDGVTGRVDPIGDAQLLPHGQWYHGESLFPSGTHGSCPTASNVTGTADPHWRRTPLAPRPTVLDSPKMMTLTPLPSSLHCRGYHDSPDPSALLLRGARAGQGRLELGLLLLDRLLAGLGLALASPRLRVAVGGTDRGGQRRRVVDGVRYGSDTVGNGCIGHGHGAFTD